MGFENVVVDVMSEQAGGRLKAVTLIQKRVRELERGWPALVPSEGKPIIRIALEEFDQELISLAVGTEAEKLRGSRVVEERERVRQIETARRAAEIEATFSPNASRPSLGAPAGAPPAAPSKN